ncbi:TPA: hypothetical protein ACH3X1_014022 [Trebouxia sp. C0004]
MKHMITSQHGQPAVQGILMAAQWHNAASLNDDFNQNADKARVASSINQLQIWLKEANSELPAEDQAPATCLWPAGLSKQPLAEAAEPYLRRLSEVYLEELVRSLQGLWKAKRSTYIGPGSWSVLAGKLPSVLKVWKSLPGELCPYELKTVLVMRSKHATHQTTAYKATFAGPQHQLDKFWKTGTLDTPNARPHWRIPAGNSLSRCYGNGRCPILGLLMLAGLLSLPAMAVQGLLGGKKKTCEDMVNEFNKPGMAQSLELLCRAMVASEMVLQQGSHKLLAELKTEMAGKYRQRSPVRSAAILPQNAVRSAMMTWTPGQS